MKVIVKRNTGMLGGIAGVALFVDDRKVKSLKNNEEYTISTDKDNVTVKAKQWFFGSKAVQLNHDESVEIKVNPVCLFLYFAAIILVFIGGINPAREVKLIFSLIGVAFLIFVLIFSMKSWFIIHKSKDE